MTFVFCRPKALYMINKSALFDRVDIIFFTKQLKWPPPPQKSVQSTLK